MMWDSFLLVHPIPAKLTCQTSFLLGSEFVSRDWLSQKRDRRSTHQARIKDGSVIFALASTERHVTSVLQAAFEAVEAASGPVRHNAMLLLRQLREWVEVVDSDVC